jgi:DNA-directed RNA polymerase beta subunit
MEKDCLSSSAATYAINEKFIRSSDSTPLYFCRNCGMKAIYNQEDNLKVCDLCDDEANVVAVDSTKVTNILFEYLKMLSLDTRVKLSD